MIDTFPTDNHSISAPGLAPRVIERLKFQPLTLDDIPRINAILHRSECRTCDFTIGGIYMWIDYFHYRYAIVDDTLFIKGRTENHRQSTAFSLPIGAMPLPQAVGLIVDYCEARSITPRFSAIPEDKLRPLLAAFDGTATELSDWSDYLYDANELATFVGKRFNKKRNHLNRFMADNPRCSFQPLTPDLLPEVAEFYAGIDVDPGDTAANESRATIEVLRDYARYPFEGAVLRDNSGRIVAFTVGEVIGDTFFDHIEKIDHSVAGAGETLTHLMARRMVDLHHVKYINREEDCGDPGLRRAKESYHPLTLLRKFNVTPAL